MMNKISRRLVLRGAGSLAVGLPLLESIGRPKAARAAAEPVVPSFAIFMRQANGCASAQSTQEVGNEPERFWPRSYGALDPANVEGRALDDVLRSLAQWGSRTMGSPAVGDCWSQYAVHMRFRPEFAVDGTYEIRFDGGDVMTLDVRHGTLTTIPGEASEPTLVAEVDPEKLHALIEGLEPAASVVAAGGIRLLTGSVEELDALARMFAPADAHAAAAAA